VASKPFEEVVTEHGRTVLRVCRAILGPADADDAWSETFLSALRAYPDLPPGSNIEAWLVTIAKRKSIDQHRQRTRRPVPVEEVPEVVSPPAHGIDDRDDDLWQALESLPPKQRDAVAFHHVAGLPYAEVAELLGNNEAAARRAAADGVKRLRATYPARR
jgi:RNA polymerase sigma factor (sigma-70 family)